MASRSLGKVEAYLIVREILPEASKGADGVFWCEFSGFGRFRFATLGLASLLIKISPPGALEVYPVESSKGGPAKREFHRAGREHRADLLVNTL